MKIDFEYFMQEKHCEQYIGTKDAMVDDFADWCDGLSIDDWFDYGNKFAKEVLKKGGVNNG